MQVQQRCEVMLAVWYLRDGVYRREIVGRKERTAMRDLILTDDCCVGRGSMLSVIAESL